MPTLSEDVINSRLYRKTRNRVTSAWQKNSPTDRISVPRHQARLKIFVTQSTLLTRTVRPETAGRITVVG